MAISTVFQWIFFHSLHILDFSVLILFPAYLRLFITYHSVYVCLFQLLRLNICFLHNPSLLQLALVTTQLSTFLRAIAGLLRSLYSFCAVLASLFPPNPYNASQFRSKNLLVYWIVAFWLQCISLIPLFNRNDGSKESSLWLRMTALLAGIPI